MPEQKFILIQRVEAASTREGRDGKVDVTYFYLGPGNKPITFILGVEEDSDEEVMKELKKAATRIERPGIQEVILE